VDHAALGIHKVGRDRSHLVISVNFFSQ
jgi:hypothetical protein